MDEQRAAYVALALIPGIGPSRMHAILQACHTATGAFSAPFAFLCSIPGLTRAAASAVVAGRAEAGAQAIAQVGDNLTQREQHHKGDERSEISFGEG